MSDVAEDSKRVDGVERDVRFFVTYSELPVRVTLLLPSKED